MLCLALKFEAYNEIATLPYMVMVGFTFTGCTVSSAAAPAPADHSIGGAYGGPTLGVTKKRDIFWPPLTRYTWSERLRVARFLHGLILLLTNDLRTRQTWKRARPGPVLFVGPFYGLLHAYPHFFPRQGIGFPLPPRLILEHHN